ncbi:hypothetical protein [Kutzneria sp. 744]|uniref:hypothetical protein n=1 Tax=Kutzneria sp. (strain 744) TaxID=345341 RepID=UPI0003EECBAB|nr:hypothetical protein [Kutzneria sp. 744]EWM19757.1 hypothetical protein KUTG_10061 [Kutzneria sp. 744]
MLEAMMGLPAGVPVAVDDLTERERRLLPRAPRGAVERDGDLLVRRAVPPVLRTRAMLLPTPPADPDDAVMQGVVLRRRDRRGHCGHAAGHPQHDALIHELGNDFDDWDEHYSADLRHAASRVWAVCSR